MSIFSSHPEYSDQGEAYSKSVTQAVNNGQTALRDFNHKSAFPKFKKKGRSYKNVFCKE